MPKTPGAPLGLAIAGLGMAGAVMVRAAAAHPGVTIVAAAETHAAPREAFARDFNVRVYDDIGAMCADPAVGVVYIATPHQFHAPHAILAAQHGKHIILEKPMALTLADCDAIIAAVEKAGGCVDAALPAAGAEWSGDAIEAAATPAAGGVRHQAQR